MHVNIIQEILCSELANGIIFLTTRTCERSVSNHE